MKVHILIACLFVHCHAFFDTYITWIFDEKTQQQRVSYVDNFEKRHCLVEATAFTPAADRRTYGPRTFDARYGLLRYLIRRANYGTSGGRIDGALCDGQSFRASDYTSYGTGEGALYDGMEWEINFVGELWTFEEFRQQNPVGDYDPNGKFKVLSRVIPPTQYPPGCDWKYSGWFDTDYTCKAYIGFLWHLEAVPVLRLSSQSGPIYCSTSYGCPDGHICNFDYGSEGGFCESCSAIGDCIQTGFINALGTNECLAICNLPNYLDYCYTSYDCANNHICNFDFGSSGGFCEDCDVIGDCVGTGFISDLGTQECLAEC